jgi:hypothetical protein
MSTGVPPCSRLLVPAIHRQPPPFVLPKLASRILPELVIRFGVSPAPKSTTT